jgi:glycosidase
MAADKAYGTRDDIKEFVEAAHQHGIAVVLDMVVNHAFGLNPMVKLYWDAGANHPSSVNPWLNQQSMHPYSVGYDFNHESGHTRQFFKDVFQYWLSEYKVDGFRLDLSKGLTQNYTGNDIGAWNAYDQSRINILNDYKAHIKWVNPNAYVILEHFANNDEETVLANSGFLLWSGMHNNYKQVAMGWQTNSNVSWAYHGNRGWTYPNLVDYMETHDEERMLYEALNNGNSTNPMYDIKYFANGLHHQEQGIVLFMGIPGPKMVYEFQEMGYDYSKFYGGSNVAPKPPRWDYLDHPGREKLNRVMSAMAKLRKSDAFRYGAFTSDLALDGKKIWITHSSMDVVISVNMGVNGFIMAPGFTHAGTWYN